MQPGREAAARCQDPLPKDPVPAAPAPQNTETATEMTKGVSQSYLTWLALVKLFAPRSQSPTPVSRAAGSM